MIEENTLTSINHLTNSRLESCATPKNGLPKLIVVTNYNLRVRTLLKGPIRVGCSGCTEVARYGRNSLSFPHSCLNCPGTNLEKS